MELRLKGCSNSGFSLTEFRKGQILELSSWVYEHIKDEDKSYLQIQNEIEIASNSLDASSVRMLVPFFRKMGYINNEKFEHKNDKIVLNDFFTFQGRCFIKYLILTKEIYELQYEDINKKIAGVNELYNIVNIFNLNDRGEAIYLNCIRFIKKYNTMDKNEFFLMTTFQEKYSGDSCSEMVDKAIFLYRKNREKYQKRIKIIKHENSFGYVKKFLMESNIVIQDKLVLKLNDKYAYIFNLIN